MERREHRSREATVARTLAVLLAFALPGTLVHGQQEGRVEAAANRDYTIHLLRGAIGPEVPSRNDQTRALAQLREKADAPARIHVLLQLTEIPSEATRAGLRAQGVALHSYLSNYAWIASLPPAALEGLLRRPDVRLVKPWLPEDKLHPRLAAGEIGPWARDEESDLVNLVVVLHGDVPLARGEELLREVGGLAVFAFPAERSWSAWVPEPAVAALAEQEEIYWLEEVDPPLDEMNDGARLALNVPAAAAPPHNLTGSGVNVFVFDGGRARLTHEKLSGHITAIDSATNSDHATHVATTVAGDRTPDNRANGMAPAAWILSAGYSQGSGTLFYDSFGDMITDYSAARNLAAHPADLATNSIGANLAANGYDCNLEGAYGQSSRMIDRISRGDEDLIAGSYKRYIVTWAAGNERSACQRNMIGNCTSNYGRCGGGYDTLPPPASAKNPITVGALFSDYDAMTDFSSWGPTNSGRLKPVVTGPGCELLGEGGIYSAIATSDTAYDVYCGTSMATPAVAGVVALLLEQYHTLAATTEEPWNAAIKALLIHTAKDLGPDGPDFMTGFGKVDAAAATDLLARHFAGDPAVYFHDVRTTAPAGVSQGNDLTWTVDVPAGSAELKVSLAWDDYFSAAGTTGALVNDLDLEVHAPGGAIAYPWVLNAASPWLAATTGVNSVDNTEQVVVANPAAGTWTVHVKGTTVPFAPQSFGLVTSVTPDPNWQCTNLIDFAPAARNGGFETAGDWTFANGAARTSAVARTGSWSLELNPVQNTREWAFQTVTFPADATRAELSYWWRMTTTDQNAGNDWLVVDVRDTAGTLLGIVDYYHNGVMVRGSNNIDPNPRWAPVANVDLLPWAGQTVQLWLRAGNSNDTSLSNFWVDDVRLEICVPNPCTPLAAPSGLAAAVTMDNRIDLSWSSVPGAVDYRIYRSTTTGGPYAYLATVTAPTVTHADTSVTAGVTYFYVVRSFGSGGAACESGNSNEASATATGVCDLPPLFAGISSATPQGDCSVALAWSAGTPQCAGPVRYAIYRHTATPFTPDVSNRIATGVAGTTYSDASGFATSTTYYYIVQAVDESNGVEGTNAATASALPAAGSTTVNLYPASGVQTFDSWTAGSMGDWTTGSFGGSTDNWRGARACNPTRSGANVLRYGGNNCSSDYSKNRHVFAQPPVLSVPATATDVIVDFWHRWSVATDGDGFYLRISLDGTNYTYIESTAFLAGGYNGLSGTTGVWNGNQSSSFTRSTLSLSGACDVASGSSGGCAGRTVHLAWAAFSNDNNTTAPGWYIDDVVITAEIPGACGGTPLDVAHLTVTSRPGGACTVEWQNPPSLPVAYGGTRLAARTDGYPAGPADSPVASQAGTAGSHDSFTHTIGAGTTAHYRAFVNSAANFSGVWSGPGLTTRSAPQGTIAGPVQWAFSTGATSLASPRRGFNFPGVFVASNDRRLYAMQPGAAGGTWPAGWKPAPMNAPATLPPALLQIAAGDIPSSPATVRAAFAASTDGHVTAFDADTGAGLWRSAKLGAMLAANPMLMHTAHGGIANLVFAGTRDAAGGNALCALRMGDGTTAWCFANSVAQGGDGLGIGIISGPAYVDASWSHPSFPGWKRAFFSSRGSATGSPSTLWAVRFTASAVQKLWAIDAGANDGAPTPGGAAGQLVVGNNAGEVRAVDAATGAVAWTRSFAPGPVKEFVSGDSQRGRLLFSTEGAVWSIPADGSTGSDWSVALDAPSRPLWRYNTPYVYVGACATAACADGKLVELDSSAAWSTPKSVTIPAASWLGGPTIDVYASPPVLHVGSASGRVYTVAIPLP